MVRIKEISSTVCAQKLSMTPWMGTVRAGKGGTYPVLASAQGLRDTNGELHY